MVSGALCSALPSIAFAQTQKLAPEYDVIVIGSGFAGLAAAISAAENGAKVVVLEKMQVAGGNSSRSGGMMAIPGSSVQKEQGIEDSPAKLAADMKRIGLGLGDPEHIKVVTELAAPTFEWTKKQGVVWRTDLTGKGGHSARPLPDYGRRYRPRHLDSVHEKAQRTRRSGCYRHESDPLGSKQRGLCHWCYRA